MNAPLTNVARRPLAVPVESTRERDLQRIRQIAKWMDAAYQVPGTRFRIGWDSLLGLIPGVGDVATSFATTAIIAYGVRLGVRKRVIVRMLGNLGIDLAVGSIPLLGDLFDATFKANQRNVRLIERDLQRGGPGQAGRD